MITVRASNAVIALATITGISLILNPYHAQQLTPKNNAPHMPRERPLVSLFLMICITCKQNDPVVTQAASVPSHTGQGERKKADANADITVNVTSKIFFIRGDTPLQATCSRLTFSLISERRQQPFRTILMAAEIVWQFRSPYGEMNSGI